MANEQAIWIGRKLAPKIFLAHAREDKLRVRALYDDLKARGFDPWLDAVDLVPGQIWKSEIPKAIRQAEIFLACLSMRSVEKRGYVHREFRIALSTFGERPPGSIYIIPVRLDDCDVPDLEIPDQGLSFQDIQWVDLWEEGGLDRLVNAIGLALGAGESQPKVVTVLRDVNEPWCPELVVIPPGNFMMGSTEPERRWAIQQGAQRLSRADLPDLRRLRESFDWEKPQHQVAIAAPFAIGKYQVTRGQFATFFEATGHDMSGGSRVFTGSTSKRDASVDWCSPGFEQTDQHPAVCVSWQDAQAYIRWLSKKTGQPYRLLSEAEWEYAARAGTGTRYWWGEDPPTPEQANFGNNVGKTREVGSYPANPWGLHDMNGNVLEWVEDCWHESYEGAPSDGSAWIEKDRGDFSRPVLRGGSWKTYPEALRSADRERLLTFNRNYLSGFRVARTLSRSES